MDHKADAAWYASIAHNARQKIIGTGPYDLVPSSFDETDPCISGHDYVDAGARRFRLEELMEFLNVPSKVTWPAYKVITNIGVARGIFVPRHVEAAILQCYSPVTGIRRPKVDEHGNVLVRYS